MFGDAQAYEQFMGRWSRLVAPPLLDFAAIPPGARVLDIGSGAGALASTLAARDPNARVTGLDPSAEYVAFANSRSPAPARVAFEVGDAQRMHFPSASFDASVSLLVWNFIPDPAKALAEARRVTRPGGAITAAVWDYGDGMRMLRVFWDAAVALDPAAENRDERHMPLCRRGELTRLWEQAGLANVQERPIEIETRFPSFTGYWDAFLLGQGPAGAYSKTLDSAKQQALRVDLKRRLAVSDEARPLPLTARVWAVRGVV